jgi:hypothetical protein
VQRLLAANSQRGRKIPDPLVAAAAEQAGDIVLHYDADFDLISTVTGQPCQWVVPAASTSEPSGRVPAISKESNAGAALDDRPGARDMHVLDEVADGERGK